MADQLAGPTAPLLDALIVGGGVAGLVAARDLVAAGYRVRLVERQARLGGVILTEREAGLTIEAGPDSMLAQKPAGLELCHELGLDSDIIPTQASRTAFVLVDGTFHALPSDTFLGLPLSDAALTALTMLSPEGRSRMAADLVDPVPPAGETDESIGAFIRRRFGQEAVRRIAQPLLGGIHAGDVDRLSLRALFPRLAQADAAGGSLLLALRHGRPARHPDGAFRGLRHGMGQLVAALTAALPDDVAQTDAGVRSLRPGGWQELKNPPDPIYPIYPRHGTGYEVETADGRLLRARTVLLAVPAWEAARLLAEVDPTLAAQCGAIPYVSSATITLAYPRVSVDHAMAGMGFIVPRGETSTRLLAGSWVTSKWPGRAPDDLVLVRVFAGGAFDDDLLAYEDHALTSLAHRDLTPLLGLRTAPLFWRVSRWQRASPQYEVGHLDRVAAIEARCVRHPGLFLTGSAYRGVGIPDTVADARATAAQVGHWLGGPLIRAADVSR